MAVNTTYNCDICGREVKYENRHPVVKTTTDLRLKLVKYDGNDLDYCFECLKTQVGVCARELKREEDK